MNIRKAYFIAAATSFAMNWIAIPYAMPAMKEAARNAAITKAEMFADNLRGTSANPEDPKAMPPKMSIEQILRYEE